MLKDLRNEEEHDTERVSDADVCSPAEDIEHKDTGYKLTLTKLCPFRRLVRLADWFGQLRSTVSSDRMDTAVYSLNEHAYMKLLAHQQMFPKQYPSHGPTQELE